MSTETKEGMFSDLEELSHSEVKDLVKDVDIMVRSFEQEHHDLRDERKNQITLVKSMRLAVGEIEEGNQERKKLLQRFHSARKSSETARNNRDAVNKAVLLILSNVISLLAWAGFLLVSSNFLITGFLFLLALFISLYWIEKHLLLPFISTSKHKATPSYLRLRRQLTLMVCSCHVFILIHLLNMRFSV